MLEIWNGNNIHLYIFSSCIKFKQKKKLRIIFYPIYLLDWKYCVIQCTGYLKSWAPTKIGLEEQEGDGDGEACNLSCLVAVGRIQSALSIPSSTSSKPRLRRIEFVSRHALDGKFIFVDQRYLK